MDRGYESRLELMEDWYRELVGLGDREQILLHDYAPHQAWLGTLRGKVLDVGGGAGLLARFLDSEVRYVVVDPSEVWDSPEWKGFASTFRGSGPEPEFVKAGGEDLPFADGEFDAALSFWSLNHSADPARCIAEMARVVRRGGRARLVVDDVEPFWAELLSDGATRIRARLLATSNEARIKVPLARAFAAKLSGKWPIQEAHIPLRQGDVIRWLSGRMRTERAQWLDGSLTFDLVKA